ncbi:Mobile element protein [Richelia intracellularis]|nr:Mobile element protein [Richelia intracellularis]
MLQQLYNISNEELEYQVNDRLSFMIFLGLGLAEPVSDATTVWFFRQQFKQQELRLFLKNKLPPKAVESRYPIWATVDFAVI